MRLPVFVGFYKFGGLEKSEIIREHVNLEYQSLKSGIELNYFIVANRNVHNTEKLLVPLRIVSFIRQN